MSEVMRRIESKVQDAYSEIDKQQIAAVKYYKKRRRMTKNMKTKDLHYIHEVSVITTPSGKSYCETI